MTVLFVVYNSFVGFLWVSTAVFVRIIRSKRYSDSLIVSLPNPVRLPTKTSEYSPTCSYNSGFNFRTESPCTYDIKV